MADYPLTQLALTGATLLVLLLQVWIAFRLSELERQRDRAILVLEEVSPVWSVEGLYRLVLHNRGLHPTGIRNVRATCVPEGGLQQGVAMYMDIGWQRRLPGNAAPRSDDMLDDPEFSIAAGARVRIYLPLNDKFEGERMDVHLIVDPVIGDSARKVFKNIMTWRAHNRLRKEFTLASKKKTPTEPGPHPPS